MHIDKYKNKKVVVIAGGLIYRGVLKEVTDECINLKGLTGWIEIPMEKITSVREEGEKDTFASNKSIDKSFWDFPPDEDPEEK